MEFWYTLGGIMACSSLSGLLGALICWYIGVWGATKRVYEHEGQITALEKRLTRQQNTDKAVAAATKPSPELQTILAHLQQSQKLPVDSNVGGYIESVGR